MIEPEPRQAMGVTTEMDLSALVVRLKIGEEGPIGPRLYGAGSSYPMMEGEGPSRPNLLPRMDMDVLD